MDCHASRLRFDHPLRKGSALQSDLLNRSTFAHSVTFVLGRVSEEGGLVVAVEGAWGSGKTSLLHMVEEILAALPGKEQPVVVRFNPWLVGDRDSLLRQFLAKISKEVNLADGAKEGKLVAKELKTYSKAFDVLKLVPGAEPWASMIKSVVEAVGDASAAVSDHKAPDLEARKVALEKALRKFDRRIIVMIDDVDRLFPAEAFEMIRIIKAVGDLPNLGYLLAWDPLYVGGALKSLKVPFARTYLDKIVQVRLPIPPLSLQMRVSLMNRSLEALPVEAHKRYFPNGDDRHAMMFHHGLCELMEQPRDIVRLFDVVASIEPGLRGEIHLADIVGLACLITKASSVYELLHRMPQAFVGRRPGGRAEFRSKKDVIEECLPQVRGAIAKCQGPNAVSSLVQWLFPDVPVSSDSFFKDGVRFSEGHIAHPERLLIALQLSARPNDLSLVRVQQFLRAPEKREEIAATLDENTCIEFLFHIGDV